MHMPTQQHINGHDAGAYAMAMGRAFRIKPKRNPAPQRIGISGNRCVGRSS